MLKLDIPRTQLLRTAQDERARLVREHAEETRKWQAASAAYPAQVVAFLRAQADLAEKGQTTHTRRKRTLHLDVQYNGEIHFEPVGGAKPPEHPGSAPTLSTTVVDKAIAFLRMSTTTTVKTTQCELDDFLAMCCKSKGRR